MNERLFILLFSLALIGIILLPVLIGLGVIHNPIERIFIHLKIV